MRTCVTRVTYIFTAGQITVGSYIRITEIDLQIMCCGAHRSRSRGISFLPCPYFSQAAFASRMLRAILVSEILAGF